MVNVKDLLAKDKLLKEDLVSLLSVSNPEDLKLIYDKADQIRKQYKGDKVHLRGIIEFSNYCGRWCLYCGLRSDNKDLKRYRMSNEEILNTARKAKRLGYRTIVMQSGEDNQYSIECIEEIITAIKSEMDIFITLSLGERPEEEYIRMKKAGADRYLLKHETSDPSLYAKLHPDMSFENRIKCLKVLKKIGFEVGSGIMVGLPGQTLDSIASDILLFEELAIDMVGLGPYIPNPITPLYDDFNKFGYFEEGKDYPLEEMVYKVLALTRIVNKNVNLPATTALATTNPVEGREKALQRGANVLMPNVTETRYRALYEIYPSKVCIEEKPEDCRACIERRIRSINRIPF